jgi:hypothetical protein
MNNEMYVVIGEDKETKVTWVCSRESFDDAENQITQILNKEQAEKLLKEFKNSWGKTCCYRIAKLSWLD